jgi:hypothetical protein
VKQLRDSSFKCAGERLSVPIVLVQKKCEELLCIEELVGSGLKGLGSTKIPRCVGSSHSWSDSRNESEKTRECSLTAVITGVTSVIE